MDAQPLYVMLIKVNATVMRSRDLVRWIDDIETSYMEQFGSLGVSLAHVALDEGPWNFALVFPGSEASVRYLTDQISSRAPGQTEFLTMKGKDLDQFRAGR